jgi:hypothetical protein
MVVGEGCSCVRFRERAFGIALHGDGVYCGRSTHFNILF